MPDLAQAAHKAQSKTTKAAKKARSRATKGATRAQTKATKTAAKTRAKAVRTTTRAVGRPVSRRDKALRTTGRIAGTTAHAGAVAAQTGARVAVGGAQAWWGTVAYALSQEPSSRRAKLARAPRVAAAALAGAGLEFFFDPADGKRRRNDALARGSAMARRLAGSGNRQARYAAGVAKGAAHRATSKPTPPADDRTLADRVRTEVFRPAGAPKGSINIGVVDGIVYLRGELSSAEEIERIVADARRVSGVRDVESMLHLPGVGAPNSGAG
jgi:osmotically-inducible protein OsmY